MKGVTQGQIRNNAAFLENVLENIPMGIMILDTKGKILMINRWQEKISKVKRGQILGRYFHETWKRLFDQGFMGPYWDLLYKGKPYEMILDRIYPQFYDLQITVILRGAPLSHGEGFVLLHEVSEELKRDKRLLEKLTNQLSESTTFLENLIDSSPNVVVTIDNIGIIKSFNETGARIFGYKKGDIVGRDISVLFAEPLDLDVYLNENNVEILCKKDNGKTFPAMMKLTNIKKGSGEFQAILMLLTDITEQKAAAEKLIISERFAIFSELMAGIAHQINNPMVGVVNFSSLLLEKIEKEDANRTLVKTIHEAAKDCQRMLSSMMVCIQEPMSNFHRIDIRDCLESTIQDARDYIKKHLKNRITLSRRIHKKPPAIDGDPLQLHQVFRNILTNAMEAMPHGGELKVRTKIDWKESELQINFHDSGFGISEENLGRLFIPFFTTKKGGGTGLGLSFAFQMVRNHSGRIEVHSAVNKGSTFTVILPF